MREREREREREEWTGLDGWWSGMRERGGERAGWMREWGDGESRGQGWMNGRVG